MTYKSYIMTKFARKTPSPCYRCGKKLKLNDVIIPKRSKKYHKKCFEGLGY